MDVNLINEMLDSEAIAQTGLFSHGTEEYQKLFEAINGLDRSGKEMESLEKRVKNSDKPLAKFAKAVTDLINDKNNDKAMMALEDKALKSEKYDHALTFANIVAGFNGQNLYSLDLICLALKRKNADISVQKDAIEKYLDQDLLDTHYLQELARMHLAENKKDKAVIDLKKAVQRAVKKNSPQELKVCSIALDELLDPMDKNYLMNTLSRAVKTIDKDKINSILAELEKRNRDDVKCSISLLKEMLRNDPRNGKAKTALVEQYKALYGESERSLACLASSGLLSDGKVNTLQAIDKFEKAVLMEEKAFVSHSTYGIGRISAIDGQSVTIDFLGKRGHKMSLEMAYKSLTALDKNHISVLKAFANAGKLRQKVMDDPRWGLVTLIKSGDNTLKLMKSELVPDILSASEFAKFQDEVKKIIKDDQYICASLNKSDEYEVRDFPISFEEKTYRQFRNETSIYGRIKTVRQFLQAEGDQSSDSFQSMLQHFISFTNSINKDKDAGKDKEVGKNNVVSYLFLQELAKSKYGVANIQSHIHCDDEHLYSRISDGNRLEIYLDIQDAEIKKSFVDLVRKCDSKWRERLEDMYAAQPLPYISRIFSKEGDDSLEERMMVKSIALAKQSPELFTHFLKTHPEAKDWAVASLSEFDFLSLQLNIMQDFPRSQSAKYIQQNLIDNGKLAQFIENCPDSASQTALYWAIDRNQSISDIIKIKLKKSISARFPEVESGTSASTSADSILPKKLLCSLSAYNKKQKEYDNLINVEIPRNAQEIAKARELGDLRENSEYQYAKDRQKFLNATAKQMEEEISKSRIMNQEDIDPSKISFGCEVELDNDDGAKSTFTILGPWESDADRNIISYASPLGRKLYGHAQGERMEFDLNGTKYAFTIKRIEAVEIN